jgi:hypothetical protein
VLIIIWGNFAPIKENLNYKLGSNGHTFTRLREIKKTKNIDILFLGSSHTYRGFDTRIFLKEGYSSFNMGTNSQTPIQTELLLNRYLDSLNPKIIVFEVCPFVFSLDGVESSIEIISNDDINFDSFKLAIKQNNLKIYNTLIYAIYREVIHKNKTTFTENKVRNNDRYINGGFVEIKLMFYKPKAIENKEWEYNKDQFHSFKNIITMLKKRNIDFILVQAPVTSDLYNSYENNDAFDQEMRKYGDYYNFNELIDLNDTIHFFDFHHLNKNGIKIFNDKIIFTLEQKNFIK